MAAQLEADLATPPFPLALNYVWRAWSRIRRRKAGGFSGPNPIEWPDIDAFVRNTRTRLDPHDIEMIEQIDDLYLAASANAGSQADRNQAIRDGLANAGKGMKKKEAEHG
ncbi:MAG: phage tail assembly chaperone [Mesorhizobium sp.]